MKAYLFITFCLLLSACLSADMRQYGNVDSADKSITVPAGGGLIADLKDILKQQHWTLLVDKGPNIVEEVPGKNLHLKSYGTFKTRYRLLLDYDRFDTCLGHLDGAYHYDMSMIDNKTGEEIMVMGGSACGSQITEKFKDFLTTAH